MKYASFLMEYYFPLHDLACKSEGYYMGRYLAGDEQAKEILKSQKVALMAAYLLMNFIHSEDPFWFIR